MPNEPVEDKQTKPTSSCGNVLLFAAANKSDSNESDERLKNTVGALSAEETFEASKGEVKVVSVREIFKFADTTDRALMIIGAISAFACGAGLPAFSYIFGHIVNDIAKPTSTESYAKRTGRTGLIMTYVGIGIAFVSCGHVSCWMVASSRQVARIRRRFFQASLRQDIGWHDGHSPGELTSRMTGDIRVVQNGINDKLSTGIMNAAMGLLGFVFGFISCWELTLMMMAMMPFIAVMGALFAQIMSKMTEASRTHFAVAGSIATEVMENIRTVQAFGMEDYEVERFHAAVVEARGKGIRKEFASTGCTGVVMALVFITYFVSFFFGSYLLEINRADVGNIVSTFLAVLLGSFGIGFVSPSATAFTEARTAAYHLFSTIDRVPEIDIDADGEPVSSFTDSIEFRNVKFRYPTRPDMKLFEDLCLKIKKGQKVAFSGATGCGKSSIIGLIQRFYDPIEGSVLIDGRDMRKLSLHEWRDMIGIVSQEPNLFAGTIADNVRIGKHDATMEEIIEACKQANIHETILQLPDQYETSVGSVGSQLSGGQKQRIAIARALVKKPALLLLDEATSALDRKSEMEVQAALDSLMRQGGMTVVIIAHRLATIRHVDCIYYASYDGVRGSTISESGKFEELMALNGEFAVMALAQGLPPAAALAGGENSMDDDGELIGEVSVILTDEDIREQSEMFHFTERQRIPINELANWEVENTHVGVWRIMSMNRDKTWAILLGILGSAMTGASNPTNNILLGKVLNVYGIYSTDRDKSKLRSGTAFYASFFLVIAAGSMLGWIFQGFYGYAGEHLTTKLRTLLFRQILRQDQSFFDIPGRDAGTLSGMLSGDCEAIHQLWGPSIGLKIQVFCAIGVGLLIGFVYQWKLTCVALAIVPVVALANLAQQAMMMGFTQKKAGESDDTLVTEALSNVRTVTSFNLKDDRSSAFDKIVDKETPREVKKGVFVGIIYGISQFVFYGAFALCFWYGGKLMDEGEATFQEVMIASMAVLGGAMGAGEAGGFAMKMADAKKAAKRVFSVIDRVPDVDVFEEGDKDIGDGCEINFKKVQFIYPARPKQVILSSVDLRFKKKSQNGLIGQTGCGKSTIIQMLARFYNRRSGLILVNGKDLNSLDIAEWRKNISIVLQEPNLFSGTVRENIRYSARDATDAEVEEAAKVAQIHNDIIQWPEGYDTQVGYKGRSLSGGQKQRVAIARGLLRKPKLLLLDEATSALDNRTEAKVQAAIEEFVSTHSVTTITIAHRLTTVRNSDQIVVLDSGHIVEKGDHEELIAKGGEYKLRWELYQQSSQ